MAVGVYVLLMLAAAFVIAATIVAGAWLCQARRISRWNTHINDALAIGADAPDPDPAATAQDPDPIDPAATERIHAVVMDELAARRSKR